MLLQMVAAATQTFIQAPVPRSIDLASPDATLAAEFTLVSAVRELSNGRLLVVDRSERKLIVADWTTGQVVQLGRNGSGPGEYLQPTTLLALGGDSTLVPDSRNGRWLLLHGATIVATIGADAAVIRNGARVPLGADAQGHVITMRPAGAQATGRTATPRLDSVSLVRVARATGRPDTVGMLKGRQVSIVVKGPKDNPTSVDVLVHPLAAGEQAALFSDGWIAIARVDPYRVEWIGPDGKHIRGEPLPFVRVRLDQREQQAFVERLALHSGGAPRDPKSFPEWPAIMPPFLMEALLPAPDGRLWIRRPATAANPDPPYDVVDRRGALVARMNPGKNVEIVGFGRAVVYTVASDDNGIQQLQRRSLPNSFRP